MAETEERDCPDELILAVTSELELDVVVTAPTVVDLEVTFFSTACVIKKQEQQQCK